ncbi:MAG: hypothetical protein ACREUU_05435, partial [Gammaproteobacteria bacterium]
MIGLRGAPEDESICGGIPVTNFPGGNLRRLGRTTSVPQFQTPRVWNARDSISWIHGNHAWKFGGEIIRAQTGIRDVSSLLGNFDYSGRFTGGNGEWQNAIADLLLGFPTRYQQDSNTVFNQWQWIYSLYAHDDWKVNSKLILNLGLRYEFRTPLHDKNDLMTSFDLDRRAYVLGTDVQNFL